MAKKEFRQWMWFEALERLSQAQRLHQQFFTVQQGVQPAWEPPIDLLETEREVLIFFALPGVAPDAVEVVIEDNCLVVSGKRVLPEELRTALIHRLELPQGRFERRVVLPRHRYESVNRTAINGCLLITLHKLS
jgi:HSP20 family protein